jgi:hypothetical protein
MGDDFEPSADQPENFRPLSNERILVIMAVLGIAGGIAGFIWVNYYWLKSSLRKIFSAAAAGERPRMLTGTYFLRYLVIAAIVAVIYATGVVPVVALLLGLAAFGFAVVVEGVIRIVARA